LDGNEGRRRKPFTTENTEIGGDELGRPAARLERWNAEAWR
jgi:hypothetical protein